METYNIFLDYYDQIVRGINSPLEEEVEFLNNLIQKYAPQSKTILETACGTGTVAKELQKYEYKVTGLDINPHMLEKAKQIIGEKYLIEGGHDDTIEINSKPEFEKENVTLVVKYKKDTSRDDVALISYKNGDGSYVWSYMLYLDSRVNCIGQKYSTSEERLGTNYNKNNVNVSICGLGKENIPLSNNNNISQKNSELLSGLQSNK